MGRNRLSTSPDDSVIKADAKYCKELDDIYDHKLLTTHLADQSDSELSVDFIIMVTVGPQRGRVGVKQNERSTCTLSASSVKT